MAIGRTKRVALPPSVDERPARPPRGLLSAVWISASIALAACASAAEPGRWIADSTTGCLHWIAGSRAQVYDDISWSGGCKDGKANGEGVSVLRYHKDGAAQVYSFQGTLIDGKANGKGAVVQPDGGQFEAYFIDDLPSGVVVYRAADGTRYEGRLARNAAGMFVPEGHGSAVTSDGIRYTGAFQDGRPNGQGRWTFSDGSIYEGGILDSKFHGQGVVTLSPGPRVEADFRHGQLHGRVIFRLADGSSFEGRFEEGRPSGTGRFRWPGGHRFDMAFAEGKATGGTFTQADGSSFTVTLDTSLPGRMTITAQDGLTAELKISDGGAASIERCWAEWLSEETCGALLALAPFLSLLEDF